MATASESRENLERVSKERRKSVFTESYDPEEDPYPFTKTTYPKTDEQRAKIREGLKSAWLLKSLDDEEIEEVIDAIFTLPVKKGDTIIEQGQPGENFYIIENGSYDVFVASANSPSNPKKVSSYQDSGYFGEIALLCNLPRTATVIATSDGSLWGVDRQTFRRIVIRKAYEKREYHKELLKGCSLFTNLEEYEQFKILDAFDTRQYKAGETIIRQGDRGDGMYFIKEGTVRVVIDKEDKQHTSQKKTRTLATLGKNEYFGELALLTNQPRSATVIADSNVVLAFLATEDFERLLGSCREILKRNQHIYNENMKRATLKPGAC